MNAAINDAGRIYFGNEFCENLIPAIARAKKFYALARSRRKKFTFVTPFVTNAGLKKLDAVLEFLNAQHAVEVVFNDWGVFKLMKDKFPNLQPVLGRLLTKQRRDPRILRIFNDERAFFFVPTPDKRELSLFLRRKLPAALFQHYQASVINLPVFQEYLLRLGINRIEIDNLVWTMDVRVNKKLGISVYLPYGYITTSRMCGQLTLTYASCKKECKKYFFQIEDKTLPVPLYSIGNSIFYKSRPPTKEYLEQLGIDRIVYQPRLPY